MLKGSAEIVLYLIRTKNPAAKRKITQSKNRNSAASRNKHKTHYYLQWKIKPVAEVQSC